MNTSRLIVLDTETTGLEPSGGHRIIEIGCVEIDCRRVTGNTWHQFLNPERDIDAGATAVHGIRRADLVNEPKFADVADAFLQFIAGAELVIHNAPFDVGFLEHELGLMRHKRRRLTDLCKVTDSLDLARQKHPGQRNSLDALCKRYQVDNSARDLHGALLDARLLADVYLLMTGGQRALSLSARQQQLSQVDSDADHDGEPLQLTTPLRPPSVAELAEHDRLLHRIENESEKPPLWRELVADLPK
ncbi:MAG: DNA polymerase III subunit epsilon [Pseudomonadota bacterium]